MRKPLQEVDAEEGDGCLIHGGRLTRTLRYYCLDVWPHVCVYVRTYGLYTAYHDLITIVWGSLMSPNLCQ